MALPDLTGRNIQDTYKRVLHVGDGGLMYDGTGSLFTPLSASHEITTELSSSHAVSADTASFATNFTASGNISASGDIYADAVRSDQYRLKDSNGTSRHLITNIANSISFGNTNFDRITITGSIAIDSLTSIGNITAPRIIGNTDIAAPIIVSDNYILAPVISASTEVVTKNIKSSADITYTTDADGNEVGQHIFKDRTDVLATIDETGASFITNITASGNISASGYIYGKQFYQEGSVLSNIYAPIQGSEEIVTVGTLEQGTWLADTIASAYLPSGIYSSSLQTLASVTASGDISASGNVTANSYTGTFLGAFSGSAQVDHDSTANFVDTEHIDHAGVSVTAGTGLTGGGTIAATRTLNVIGGTGVTANANDIAIGQDVATTADVTFNHVTASGDISSSGKIYSANEEILQTGFRANMSSTNYFGPKSQGPYQVLWMDMGDATAVATLDNLNFNSGFMIPYSASITGFSCGLVNKGGVTNIMSMSVWTGQQVNNSNSDVTITRIVTGATSTPGGQNRYYAIDKRDSIDVHVAPLSHVYPRINFHSADTGNVDGTFTLYFKRIIE